MKTVMSIALVLLLSATTVNAEDIKCKSDGNQIGINQCAADDYAAADKRCQPWRAERGLVVPDRRRARA
ncbi:MAG: hypothetical protein A2514_13410 [Gammaproteobacteria bacterium RIFOXYD12_FULL_61_37]|nr:MAG: hypothetical protein A2514_13410 [Gammaproteobacteria bacterium RIFOXYD12_FULL_61_37]